MSYSIGFITGLLSIALPMLTNNLLLKLVIILVVCFSGSFINGYCKKKGNFGGIIMAVFKKQRCYNCKFGNKTDPKSLKMCKTCGLPFQRRNWKELITEEQQEEALFIIKELLNHCRALKALVHEDVSKLNENIVMAEKFLSEVE